MKEKRNKEDVRLQPRRKRQQCYCILQVEFRQVSLSVSITSPVSLPITLSVISSFMTFNTHTYNENFCRPSLFAKWRQFWEKTWHSTHIQWEPAAEKFSIEIAIYGNYTCASSFRFLFPPGFANTIHNTIKIYVLWQLGVDACCMRFTIDYQHEREGWRPVPYTAAQRATWTRSQLCHTLKRRKRCTTCAQAN